MLFLSAILATLLIQIPNIWAIKAFAQEPTLKNAFWIALICLPASYMASALFSYFYGKGYAELSYPTISVMVYGIGLATTFTIQVLYLKAKPVSVYEVLGVIIILAGIALIVSRR